MRKHFWNLNIAKKMIILCLSIFLVPLAICYTINVRIVTSELEKQAMNFAESFNAQTIASLDHFIQDYEAMSVSVLVDNELFTYSAKEDRTITELVSDHGNIRKVLFRLTQLQPELINASIIMKAGDFIQTGVNGIRVDEETFRSENWVQDIPESDGYFYLVPSHKADYRNRIADEQTITFVRKILSSGVRYLGALTIDVKPSAVVNHNEELASAKEKYGMEISIYDSSGRIIYDTRPSVYMDQRDDGFYQATDFGKDYIVLKGNSRELNLQVVTAIPRASALLDQRHIITLMALLALICCAIIIASIIPMSHTLTKPLAELGYGMSRMKSGEYITLNNYPYSDELGELIHSYNHMISEMQQLIDRVYKSEIKQKDSEIIALQSQINPHMLFNTLESIRMKALVNGDAEVSRMILILARMFRTILDSMGQNHVIKDELTYTEKYIELQNLREAGRFGFTYDVDEQLMSLRCIPILFQPLVENCIEHGQRNSEGKLNIQIEGKRAGDRAVFTVTDDGQAMKEENLRRTQEHLQAVRENPALILASKRTDFRNIGMANILMRLRLNDEKYGDVRIVYSNSSGTCIELCMDAGKADLSAAYSEDNDDAVKTQ